MTILPIKLHYERRASNISLYPYAGNAMPRHYLENTCCYMAHHKLHYGFTTQKEPKMKTELAVAASLFALLIVYFVQLAHTIRLI